MSRSRACFLGLFFALLTLVCFEVAPQIMSVRAAFIVLAFCASSTVAYVFIAIAAED